MHEPRRKPLKSIVFFLILLILTIFGCRQEDNPPAIENRATTGQTVLAPVPSPTAQEQLISRPAPTIDRDRSPELGISVSAETADGAFWYAFDRFDSMGGVPPGSLTSGLYRLIDGEVTHFDVHGTIRMLEVAADGILYIGAGCGLIRWDGNQLKSLLEVDCEEDDRPLSLHALNIKFDAEGKLWIGGAHNLVSYDGSAWKEFDVSALRTAIASDGSIWALGWDGHAGNQCCLTNVTPSGVFTYSWKAEVPQEIIPGLFGAN